MPQDDGWSQPSLGSSVWTEVPLPGAAAFLAVPSLATSSTLLSTASSLPPAPGQVLP